MKVVLIGYMGSGKSIIAKKLASQLEIKCLELDNLIEKKAAMTIESIFSTKGEMYFRKLEHELFTGIMLSNDDYILSTGGGTPCYYNNHEILKNADCISIYLDASLATLSERLSDEKNKRPLLAHLPDGELTEYIAKHLFDRSFYYHQAKHKVSVDGKTVDEIVNEIKTLLT